MNRLLVFHYHGTSVNEVRMAPSGYYIDGEYEKIAVRVYAREAPIRDAKIGIFDDGVSIFSNRTPLETGDPATGVQTVVLSTEAVLAAGENSEEIAEDFNDNIIEDGSWVYCNLVDAGGGSDFTVQLELHQVSEGEGED